MPKYPSSVVNISKMPFRMVSATDWNVAVRIFRFFTAARWTASFTDLDEYQNGEKIAYTIEEVTVPGYTTAITGDTETGYTVTNTHEPEKININGAKTWDDNNDQDGARPDSITIRLLANGSEVDSKTVTETDDWSWSFTNLPKYENEGIEIVYTITENMGHLCE